MQTGTRAIAVDAVFTLANGENFLQQRERFANGIAVREWAKIFAFGVFSATVHRQSWMGIAAEENKGIGFIVTQQHVITRLIQLDVVMLKQQRFRFGMGNGHVNLRDQRHQSLGFTRSQVAAKIAAKALFQIFCFANINDGTTSIIHTIDARLAGHRLEESFCVKNITH